MTPDEGLRKQIEVYRRMRPEERLRVGFELYEMARALARAGIRHQHPDWDEQQIQREVARRFRLAAGIR
jgi:Rv0078B-related antitoxin